MGVLRAGAAPAALILVLGAAGAGADPAAIDLSLPGPNPHMATVAPLLPSAETLTNPPGYEDAAKAAGELARQSEGATMQTLTDLARDAGVLPDDPKAEGPGAVRTDVPRRLPEDRRATILVSAAMSEGELKRLLAAYAGRADVRFAFRGVPEGQTVPKFAYWLHGLMDDPEAAAITLDPELFMLAGATMAPTVLIEDLAAAPAPAPAGPEPGGDIGRIVGMAVGFADPDWVWEQVRAGRGPLSRPTGVLIAEEDLRVRAERELQAKLAGLTRDPQVLIDRFWARKARDLAADPLPVAETAQVRRLSFGFTAPEDILDAEGRVLAFRGERFEPQDVLPFDRQVLVIDPTAAGQVDWAARRLQADRPSVAVRLVIVTRLPPSSVAGEPWQGLEALIARLKVKVYVLDSALRESFQIRATPTEIFPRRDGTRTLVLAAEGMADP